MRDLPAQDTWVDGLPRASAVLERGHLCDPNDGSPVQRLRSSSPEQVEQALASADRLHRSGAWSRAGVEARGDHLTRFARALDGATERIARLDALNSGVPLMFTRMFAGSLQDTVLHAVALARGLGDQQNLPTTGPGPVRLRRVPWGPTALVLPWNAPSAVAVKSLAYTLVAGSPAILKPSPMSPLSAQLVALAAEEAGLPSGAVQVLLGGASVGAALCSDSRIRAISLTGATATGRAVAAAAAPRFARLRLELGSNNPAVVLSDADVAATARHLYDGMTRLNGQWCEAPRTVHVARVVLDDLLDALGELVRSAVHGSSLADDTVLGPMAFRARRDELVAQRTALADAGGDVLPVAQVPDRGWFFPPTLVRGDTRQMPGEVFGPMLCLEPVDSDEEAVFRANAAAGGLAAYVFGGDVDRAAALGGRLLAGEVKINGTSLLDMSPDSAQSFFGASGHGGHGDRDVLDFHLGKQVVGVDLVGAPL